MPCLARATHRESAKEDGLHKHAIVLAIAKQPDQELCVHLICVAHFAGFCTTAHISAPIRSNWMLLTECYLVALASASARASAVAAMAVVAAAAAATSASMVLGCK